jgi:hypothetical protein
MDALCLLFEIAQEDKLLTRFTAGLAIPQCPLICVDGVILFIKAFTNDANTTIFVLEVFYTTGKIQGADGCMLCRRLFVGAVGTEPHLAKTPKWPSAQANRRHRLICADGHHRHKSSRRHSYSMVVGTAKTVGTAIAPARLNTMLTTWPSARPYADG